jgi:hypothetical protein
MLTVVEFQAKVLVVAEVIVMERIPKLQHFQYQDNQQHT